MKSWDLREAPLGHNNKGERGDSFSFLSVEGILEGNLFVKQRIPYAVPFLSAKETLQLNKREAVIWFILIGFLLRLS